MLTSRIMAIKINTSIYVCWLPKSQSVFLQFGWFCVFLFLWFNCNLPFKKLWQNTCSWEFLSFPALQVILASFCVCEGNAKWFMIFSEPQRESDALYLSLPTWDAISAVLLLFLWLLLDVCWLLDQRNHLIFVFCMTQAIHHILVAVQKSLFCIYFPALNQRFCQTHSWKLSSSGLFPFISRSIAQKWQHWCLYFCAWKAMLMLSWGYWID